MAGSKSLRRWVLGTLVMASSWLTAAMVANACDTPVYRYAMYRWFPAPYEVYYFHRDQLDQSAQVIQARIDKFAELEEVPANMVFLPVDLNKDKELRSVPPDVKEAWLKQDEPPIPSYLISSPLGVHLHQGQLTEKELDELIDSPKRKEAVKDLSQGKAGVFVLLTGADTSKNDEAEKLLRSVVSDVGSGKINLYMAPTFVPEGEEPESPPGLDVGFVKVSRESKAEKWFVRCLLAVEPDLAKQEGPIVFMLYGRGRALFSCLGKGIERDNLLMDIEFITGACSCTVKDQNPGVDLLFHTDWDVAAETLARQFSGEEGSEYAVGASGYPELVLPGATPGAAPEEMSAEPAASTSATGESSAVAHVAAAGDAGPSDAESGEETSGSADESSDEDSPVSTVDHSDQPTDVASEQPKNSSDEEDRLVVNKRVDRNPALGEGGGPEEKPSAASGVLLVGLGLAAALVVLFGATFMVLRPK